MQRFVAAAEMSTVALDSVLQKAEELALSLRRWRGKLGMASPATRLSDSGSMFCLCVCTAVAIRRIAAVEDDVFVSGDSPTTEEYEASNSVAKTITPTQQPPSEDEREGGVREEGGREEGVREQKKKKGGKIDIAWHHLTSYILQLEKRVRELETDRTAHTAGIARPLSVGSHVLYN